MVIVLDFLECSRKTLSGDGRGTLGWVHEGRGGSGGTSRQLEGSGVQNGMVTIGVFRSLT